MTTHAQVFIRRNADGLERVINYDAGDLSSEVVDYMWLDGGNYSCDCNRGLFFARACGESPEWNAFPCGESAYTVTKIIMGDGSVIEGEK